jgi:hypothetical protein
MAPAERQGCRKFQHGANHRVARLHGRAGRPTSHEPEGWRCRRGDLCRFRPGSRSRGVQARGRAGGSEHHLHGLQGQLIGEGQASGRGLQVAPHAGEAGTGRTGLRAPALERALRPGIFAIKKALDPLNILNPGKIFALA